MRRDPHSFSDDSEPQVERFDWRAEVDFAARSLRCVITLHLDRDGGGPLHLDSRDLAIDEVTDERQRPLPWRVGPSDPILGAPLILDLPAGARAITLRYRTGAEASALQWLTPSQTAGGTAPFLFSQCQAIHARSVIPIQDTPRTRLRYTAELVVPRAARGLMAAAHRGREEQGAFAVEKWEMPQPIPPYLLAFAVGDLASRPLGPRTAVWAEPSVVDGAAREFADVEQMLAAGERLFGPYDWERFDLLVMPPSFPYGGMENPRLTFLTPTLLAGDRSLVYVVAHELAHSWTGNLVTNADAQHFWLNEGFTVYAERAIVEELYGEEMAALHSALGRRALERAFAAFHDRPALTHLRTRLDGLDPDEVFSEVPYEKGYLFLRALEEATGRDRFRGFLRGYLRRFAFRAVETDDFLDLLSAELPQALAAVGGAAAWVDSPGLPPGAPVVRAARVERVEALARSGALPDDEAVRAWSPAEWQLWLESQPSPQPEARLAEIDRRFALTGSGNYEVLVAWLTLAAASGYPPARARIAEVLGHVGRMKYLKPLYQALASRAETRAEARALLLQNGSRYHVIARGALDGLLGRHGA